MVRAMVGMVRGSSGRVGVRVLVHNVILCCTLCSIMSFF